MTIVAQHINTDESIIEFTSFAAQEKWIKENTPQPTQEDLQKQAIDSYIDRLQTFTKDFLKEAMNENIALGISLEPLEVVETLTSSTAEISNALNLGVLQVAEDKIRTFDANLIDGKYITESRLLEWRNKIRLFRRLQPVTTYNE